MEILKYKKEYLKKCRSLWAEMVQHHRDIYDDPSIGGDNPGIEFDQHLCKVGSDRVWLAMSGEKIVGLTALIMNGQEAEIEPVVVASGYRGRGVGRILLNHVIKISKELGVLCLSVKPVARNLDAISFFHSSGFKTLGHIQMFMWLGESATCVWNPGPTIFEKSFFV